MVRWGVPLALVLRRLLLPGRIAEGVSAWGRSANESANNYGFLRYFHVYLGYYEEETSAKRRA